MCNASQLCDIAGVPKHVPLCSVTIATLAQMTTRPPPELMREIFADSHIGGGMQPGSQFAGMHVSEELDFVSSLPSPTYGMAPGVWACVRCGISAELLQLENGRLQDCGSCGSVTQKDNSIASCPCGQGAVFARYSLPDWQFASPACDSLF